jgi:hypothetical protein
MLNIEQSRNYFILVGDRKTWNASLIKKNWGFSEKTKRFWNTAKSGDLIAFYVMRPTKKIIGFGKLKRKFIDETIFWPEEILSDKIIWKYRIQYSVIHIESDWKNGIDVPKNIMLNQGRKKITEKDFLSLIKTAEKKWNITKFQHLKKKLGYEEK